MSIKMTSKSNKPNTTINEALNKKLKKPKTIVSTSTKMTSKMTYNNKTMKYAITEHFAEQGKRITNLTKAKKDKLISYIDKNNIDVDKYAKQLKEQEKAEKEEMEREREEMEREQIKWKKKEEEAKKTIEKIKQIWEEKNISLTFLQKRRVNMEMLKQELYFKNNADKIKQAKIEQRERAISLGNKTYGYGKFNIEETTSGLRIVPKIQCGMIQGFDFELAISGLKLYKDDETWYNSRYRHKHECKYYNYYYKSQKQKNKKLKLKRKINVV